MPSVLSDPRRSDAIGSQAYSQAFLVGASKEFEIPVSGRLYLGLNQSEKDAAVATGTFEVKVETLEEGSGDAASVGGPSESRVAGITPDILSKIPRRVSDPDKNPGDMVNVLIVGTQEQVVQVFTSAGWVEVDKSVRNTAMNAVLNSLEKKDYLTMPMSTLFLFDRAQDYGFAHAEPVKLAMSRNHLRVWKSPYTVDGRPLWCVAATHDIGFERDQRNNGLTHKIDPAIDGEREFVNGTLSGTGLVVQRDHVTPADPLTTAKTATGGEFHSDGRILVLGTPRIRRDRCQRCLPLAIHPRHLHSGRSPQLLTVLTIPGGCRRQTGPSQSTRRTGSRGCGGFSQFEGRVTRPICSLKMISF